MHEHVKYAAIGFDTLNRLQQHWNDESLAMKPMIAIEFFIW